MLLAADFLLYIVRWCSIIASHSTKSNIKIVIAGIFFIFLFLYLFSKILFWTETGSFHRTITKTDAVEFVIECDPFDVLAVAKELEPYAKKYTDVEVELKYIEYSFKGNEITAMYGFKGTKYRKGRGETIQFYLDIDKHTLYEISYFAAGGKEFSSFPSQYFNADINIMDEYEKIKNSNPDFDSIEEIQFILSNNHCEIFYAKRRTASSFFLCLNDTRRACYFVDFD